MNASRSRLTSRLSNHPDLAPVALSQPFSPGLLSIFRAIMVTIGILEPILGMLGLTARDVTGVSLSQFKGVPREPSTITPGGRPLADGVAAIGGRLYPEVYLEVWAAAQGLKLKRGKHRKSAQCQPEQPAGEPARSRLALRCQRII